jgi:hypothetical protein
MSDKKDVTCGRCGAMGLHWEEAAKGWRLFTPEGVVHTCYNTDKDKTKSVEKQSWKWDKKKRE